jgi:hypothetical protein
MFHSGLALFGNHLGKEPLSNLARTLAHAVEAGLAMLLSNHGLWHKSRSGDRSDINRNAL